MRANATRGRQGETRLTRRMLTDFIGGLGHEVLEAQDGAEALAIAQEQRIRFIITDR